MGEASDDFGELYADVQLPFFGSNQSQSFNASNYPDSDSRRSKVVSYSSTSDEEDDEHTLVPVEVGCNESIVCQENGSDSEDDDLHIVLNDEDCPVGAPLPPPRYARAGNARGIASSDNDEGDDLVIVAGENQFSKDGKRTEPYVDGAEQLSQFSQFKYIRPHAKASGSYSMIGGRGDWDSDVGGPPIFSSSGAVISPQNLRIPFVSRNGSEFYLPRNRTIFDVSIDKFEQKPWRNSGVDKTDFFNFGLDEESWKMYCLDLEHFRQQTAMNTGIHVYRSSGTKRVLGSGILHEFQSSKAAPTEICLMKKGENSFSAPENNEIDEEHFEMPKGRAIQVEDSMIERMSSMDVKRIRYRDSDVVIQIPVQDGAENSSVFAQDEPDLKIDPSPIKHEKKESDISNEQMMQERGSSSADGSRSSLTRDYQAKAICSSLSQNEEKNSHENSRESNLSKVSDGEENGLDLSEKGYESSTLNHSQSVSGQFDMENHHSDDSGIQATLVEILDSASNNSQADSGTSESQNCCSREKFHTTVDLRRHKYNNGRSLGSFTNDWDSEEHTTVRHGTRTCKERQHVYAYNKKEDLSYYQEKKTASYDGCRLDERQITRSAPSKFYIRANLDRRYGDVRRDLTFYNLEKRLPKNELRERECYSHKRRHVEQRICERDNIFSNLYNENERCIYQNQGGDNDRKVRYRVEELVDEEHDEAKYEPNNHERLRLHPHRRESAQDKCGRHVPPDNRKLEKLANVQFDRCRHFGLRKTGRQFYHVGPLSDHAYRDYHISDRKDCHLSSPQRNDECYSWRLSSRHADEWQAHQIHRMTLKDNDGDCIFSSGKVHRYTLPRLQSPGFERDGWGEIAFRDRRNDDFLYYKFCDQDISYQIQESFSYKRSLGHIDEHGGKILDRNHLAWRRKHLVGEQCTYMGINDRDGTLNCRESVQLHMNDCRTKYQPGRRTEDRDLRGHRHSHLSNGYSPIFRHHNEIHTGKEVSGDRRDPFPEFSAEDNDGKGLQKHRVVEQHKISGSEVVSSTTFQSNELCKALPKRNFEKAKLTLNVKLNCSDKFEHKTLKSADGTSDKTKAIEEYEQRRILETLVKMERRKERFKASIISEKEPSASSKRQKSEALDDAAEVKLQRPVRKRRWREE